MWLEDGAALFDVEYRQLRSGTVSVFACRGPCSPKCRQAARVRNYALCSPVKSMTDEAFLSVVAEADAYVTARTCLHAALQEVRASGQN